MGGCLGRKDNTPSLIRTVHIHKPSKLIQAGCCQTKKKLKREFCSTDGLEFFEHYLLQWLDTVVFGYRNIWIQKFLHTGMFGYSSVLGQSIPVKTHTLSAHVESNWYLNPEMFLKSLSPFCCGFYPKF